tara:strand:+ start:18532 stop:18834 length:303 start_codon:yes stop_codon:yes gene_type:complete
LFFVFYAEHLIRIELIDLFLLGFQNFKVYLFVFLVIQFFGLPRNAFSESKTNQESIVFNRLTLNEELLNLQNQKFSTELFYLNDELNILDRRIKALLRKN